MLYYCVCFEASSLVISGQPFCLFFFPPLHHIPAPQFCTVYLLSVQFCSPARWIFIIGLLLFFSTLKTSHEKQERSLRVCRLWPQHLFLTGHTVTSCTSYFSAILRACVRNSELSLGACLPACLPVWPVPLLSTMLILKRAGECESLCRVCLNSAKEHIVRPVCLHACVCAVQVHEYQMYFSHHEQTGIFFLLQIPKLQTS